MNIRGGGISSFSLTYNERLYNFNRILQNNIFLDKLKPGGHYYTSAYKKFDDKNKEFADRVLRGELVTSTEMNEIINIPHILSDGTESCWTFAECFADHCGWYTNDVIRPIGSAISDITWFDFAFPLYITMNNNYLC